MKTKWSTAWHTGFIAASSAAFLALAVVTFGQEGAWTSSGDRQFMQKFGATSLEIEKIGQMAQIQSDNPQLRTLGQWLVRDYYQAAVQVGVNGRALGIGQTPLLESNAVVEVHKLADLSGSAFDQAGARALLRCQREATNQLTYEAQTGGNLALRQSATVLGLELTPVLWRTVQVNALFSGSLNGTP